ncbi:RsmB/NOP family class I SAM-dependent RNA methyltransferase [Paragemmobacter ruber]|uniref:RsmB/NOP family class I SAM-dependent RNA methyltransferase n=1 Tax=Paragemmobacter ruber TaxID=1985673 RepID=A0ABW9Y932_9RHOB|nr:RsmB/NOP family class I SAM-dependent RNA methyltransferase [Rhodobacter ruber]NBE08546.1 RsmB/NOP family class I SAM-dependent RNA methyltransferase [Rhodobacter ruber]
MTPGARAAAAIAVLDRVLEGQPAEMALTNWGRANRYAGSGDRAAVRDIVFDVLRCKRSCAARGGALTGRGLVLGWARGGLGREALFDGQGHAPAPPGAGEAGRVPEGAEALDCPDWLEAPLRASLGADFEAVMAAMQERAPVFLRVNLARLLRGAAVAMLAAEGIEAVAHPLAASALEVRAGARKVQASAAYREGLVELQDAASQAVVEMLPLRDGMAVLDLCAGGGGKTLAMAARAGLRLWAHDAERRRMADLPVRAARAGVAVTLVDRPEAAGPFDLVLADVPCSGAGSWRRDPEGKWALTAARLAALREVQAGIMDRAAALVRPGGVLGYATCSLLDEENGAQVERFLARRDGWTLETARRFTPLDGGDGFFCAVLRRG